MSFEVWFARFSHGAAQRFPYACILEAFAGCKIERDDTRLATLRFPDGAHCELYAEDSPEIYGLMLARPPYIPSCWRGLFRLMQLAHGTVYWPGGSAVADPAVIPHLPEDFVTPLVVVQTPEDLVEAIRRS